MRQKGEEQVTAWLEMCNSCKKRHRMVYQKCPECGVYETPQPGEYVKTKCRADYACDGCHAYRDHQR